MKYLFIVFLFLPVLLKAGIGADTIKKNNDSLNLHTKRNAVYMEGLGACLTFYSLNYERMIHAKKINLFLRIGATYVEPKRYADGAYHHYEHSLPFVFGIKMRQNKKINYEFGLGATYYYQHSTFLHYDYNTNNFSTIWLIRTFGGIFPFAEGTCIFNFARTFFASVSLYCFIDSYRTHDTPLGEPINAFPGISFGKRF